MNWDTNTAFALTISAPDGKKFAVTVPPGARAGFDAFLWWEAGDRGGFSGSGRIGVSFENLEGSAPDFYESDAVLSSSHGFFGVADLESTLITEDLAFTAMTIYGYVSPQVTGSGTRTWVPHHESRLMIYNRDPAVTVAIVAVENPSPQTATGLPMLRINAAANGSIIVTFSGALQFAASPGGPFQDVPGKPQGSYTAPAGVTQFFRARN